MNCANHAQTPAAAYCRTCGKPLCTHCTRPVMGVIYCENCLADRLAGNTTPPAPYQPVTEPGQGVRVPPGSGSGPNAALAGILGAIPFGVGAIYNGQYAKGLAHLGIFILLVMGTNQGHETLATVCGIGIAAFVIYQIIDAVKTAKAIQAGQPAPDPFGLATMFSPGDKPEFAKGVPAGAIVLIGLGVLFLLHNLGFWFLSADRLWPLVLIGLGVWLFAKRQASINRGDYRPRSLVGPAVLVTVGVLALLDDLHGPNWDRTWPVLLLVIGVVKLMERSGHLGTPSAPVSVSAPPTGTVVPPEPQPTNEVKNG